MRSHAEIAQSVEQGTENPRVSSSILDLGTRGIKTKRRLAATEVNLLFYRCLLMAHKKFSTSWESNVSKKDLFVIESG